MKHIYGIFIIFILCSIAYTQTIPTNGLVAYYPFNGNVNDESGNGHSGTVYGATLSIDRFGRQNQSYAFNGTTDKIDIGNNVKPSFPLSVGLWIKPGNLQAYSCIFRNDGEGISEYHGVSLYLLNGGKVEAMVGNGSTNSYHRRSLITNDIALTENNWHFIVVNFVDYNNISIYVDGIQRNGYYEGSGTGMSYSNENGTIGTNFSNPSIIDDVRIFNRMLTNVEIQSLHDEASAFTEIVTGLPGVYNSSSAWGDYDSDGDLDVLVTGLLTSGTSCISKVFRNDNGSFVDINSGLIGVYLSSSSWGDYDNDGDLDILITGYTMSGGTPSRIYRNDNGIFTDINAGLLGINTGSSAWSDIDCDGDLDVIISGAGDSGYISKIYVNNNGAFTDINAGLPGLSSSSIAFGDYDNDGDNDLFLSGCTSAYETISRIYNNNNGIFTDICAGLQGVYSGSADWGDYDNDGDLDLLYMGRDYNGTYRVTKIYRNDNSVFTDTNSALIGMVSGSLDWGDYDNDGDLDIIQTGVVSIGNNETILYTNNNGVFNSEVTNIPNVSAGSVQWGDYNNDSKLDILLTGAGDAPAYPLITNIYQNNITITNNPPSFPDSLTALLNGNQVTLSWFSPDDDHTPTQGLTYNLAIGTSPNNINIISPMSDINTGYRRIPTNGNIGHALSYTFEYNTQYPFYWGVQAVDTAFSGSLFTTSVFYGPAQARFSASDSTGFIPLSIEFTDESLGNITSWQWDFNNDGVIDSNEQNPNWIYQTSGTYTVTLTVSNGISTDTDTKVDYITVFLPLADFTAIVTSGYVPLTVSFTDTSTGTPLSWAWDFNNDGVTDSYEQNPDWTYQYPGTYTVSLTVTFASGTDTEIKTNYITTTLNPTITKHVPSQYSTIQAAINAASNGDYIIVADGIYYENLQIVGKEITLASQYFTDGDSTHIDDTVIDGSQTRNRNEASVIAIRPGTSPGLSSHIIGFTVTHGGGRSITQTIGGTTVQKTVGGGIFIDSNNPVLTKNKIVENDADDEGGGSYAFQSLPNMGGLITAGRVNQGGNLFRDNHADIGRDMYIDGAGSRDVVNAENCDFNVFCAQDTTVTAYYATTNTPIRFTGSHGQTEAITSDIWVAIDGNDADNNGLSEASPFLTIDHALSLAYGSQSSPIVIHLASGTYSPSQTGERFPLQMVSWVSLVGAGTTETFLDAEATVDMPNRVINLDHVEGCQIRDLSIQGGVVTATKGKNGAGIAGLNSELQLSGLNFSGLSAAGDGAGMYMLNSQTHCERLNINSNTAVNNGGGVYIGYGSASIINSNFSLNNALYGGGLYVTNSDFHLNGCDISDNQTTGSARRGGGIYLAASDSSYIENSTINSNIADFGAGIFLQSATNVRLINNRIVNNLQNISLSANGGGGLYWNANTTGLLADNLIANNTAYQGGAGFGQSALDFYNNTITNNRATYKGGGFYLNSCSPSFWNSILWGNAALNNGNQIYLQNNSSDPNFRYCDVSGGTTAFGLNTGSYTGTYQNNLNTNPLFVTPTTGTGNNYNALTADWSLQSSSPCKDSGMPNTDITLYHFDLNGNPRIDGIVIDMGAYEYQYTVAPGVPGNVVLSYANGQLNLHWDSVMNANSYLVYVADNPMGPFNTDISNQGVLSLNGNRYTWTMPFNQLFRQFYVVKSSTRAP